MKLLISILLSNLLAATLVGAENPLPTLKEALASKLDLWGEAAMAQPNGPSYEFFAPLLPPPRYVNADFRHYPIVLSAPNAKVKARLISNGSGVNLKGGARSWNDNGTPILFRVGPDELLFGSLADRVSEPTLAEGWLPIVQIHYSHRSPVQSEGVVPLDQPKHDNPPEIYRLEAFASTDESLADNGIVLVKFDLTQGTNGFVAAEIAAPPPLEFAKGQLTDAAGQILAYADAHWKFTRGKLTARLKPGSAATLALPTKPASAPIKLDYNAQRARCVETWKALLDQGMSVRTPEPVVNHAARHLICQNFQLITGDRIHYSAGNQYNQIYQAEGSDAMLALLSWGYERDARRLIVPLLDFTRKGLEYHQAGFKLLNVARYYWQTRDPRIITELRPRWELEADRLVNNRTGEGGLFPKEQYCGDIHTLVYSLNANAKAWQALHHLGAALAQAGFQQEAARYTAVAADFKIPILAALEKSISRKTDPPFVPVALFGDEPVHDPILHSRIGSYWNIIIGFTMASSIFPPGSPEESWIAHYQEQHGGLCMGMLRSGGGQFNFWTSDNRINPLYGTRYALDTLRRDEPLRALVCFYGLLAQGFTRNTFISGEGCNLDPVDERGRMFYCPPNSAANAHFLTILRNLLVQDPDTDGDGKPETLRLAFATPQRWLEDGKIIQIDRAPTAFGPLSYSIESHLAQGKLSARFDLPSRNPASKILARFRLPAGHRILSAHAQNKNLPVDAQGTVDLTGLPAPVTVEVTVEKQ